MPPLHSGSLDEEQDLKDHAESIRDPTASLQDDKDDVTSFEIAIMNK